MGVADAMQIAQLFGGTVFVGLRACMPEHADAGQITDVAVRFLASHPERRHLPAVTLVAEALAEAFPCPPG
jgi:hypothetical protein